MKGGVPVVLGCRMLAVGSECVNSPVKLSSYNDFCGQSESHVGEYRHRGLGLDWAPPGWFGGLLQRAWEHKRPPSLHLSSV